MGEITVGQLNRIRLKMLARPPGLPSTLDLEAIMTIGFLAWMTPGGWARGAHVERCLEERHMGRDIDWAIERLVIRGRAEVDTSNGFPRYRLLPWPPQGFGPDSFKHSDESGRRVNR
jgi:hypothetical protein